MSSLSNTSRLLLLIIALQPILNSPFDQREFTLAGSGEGSQTVEDFISSVKGFELMKYSPNSSLQPLEAVGKEKSEYNDDGGEENLKVSPKAQ